MATDDDLPICKTCGKPIRTGDPRYRTADGESHVRCHEGPRVLVIEDEAALLELIVGVVERSATSPTMLKMVKMRSAIYPCTSTI
jgi:hypothetical protein